MNTEPLKQVSREDARRNPEHQACQDGSTSPTQRLRLGEYDLDLHRRQLSKDGLPVKVPGKVYQALVALVETPGELVTREELRVRLWPRDTQLNYDANVNTTVNKLRQILGDTNEESKFIETIPRKGYRFIAKVECINLPATNAEVAEAVRPKESAWNFVGTPEFLRSGPARIWFTASVIALVMAAILFGAAITLFSHRSVRPEMASHPAGQATDTTSKP
jgi:DNA-binding winged helix-turn-helix (wHTH) protein